MSFWQGFVHRGVVCHCYLSQLHVHAYRSCNNNWLYIPLSNRPGWMLDGISSSLHRSNDGGRWYWPVIYVDRLPFLIKFNYSTSQGNFIPLLPKKEEREGIEYRNEMNYGAMRRQMMMDDLQLVWFLFTLSIVESGLYFVNDTFRKTNERAIWKKLFAMYFDFLYPKSS